MRHESNFLEKRAYEIRRNLGLDSSSPIDISDVKKRMEKVSFVSYPLSKGFSGFIYKLDTDSAVIVVNSILEMGRQNFALCHEIYHYYFSSKESRITYFLESHIKSKKKDSEEIDADRFASFFLMPRFPFLDYFYNECGGEIDINSVVKLENYYHVNRYTVVSRLENEFKLNKEKVKELMIIDKEAILKMGFSTTLHEVAKDSDTPKYEGYYSRLAEKLLDSNKIGQSKFEELSNVFETE